MATLPITVKENTIIAPEKEGLIGNAILIESRAAETEGLSRKKSHFSTGEKNALKYPGKSCW